MTACLSAVEIAHIIFLERWNSEVFSGITTLIGLVTGILIGQQA
jgi:xanthine/uracil permease